jgi:hypothetical protein
MKTCWFTVIESRGRWWIDCEGKAYGPMPNREEAAHFARLVAETYGPADREAMVWVPDEKGRHRLFWSGRGRV